MSTYRPAGYRPADPDHIRPGAFAWIAVSIPDAHPTNGYILVEILRRLPGDRAEVEILEGVGASGGRLITIPIHRLLLRETTP